MDMNSLIHHASPESVLREPPYQSAGLPGLRAHFPSLPIRLPVFRPASPSDRAMPPLSLPQDHRCSPQPPAPTATTLAPLRFIIPSSHCSNSSMNAYSSTANSSEPVNYRSASSVPIKAEPEPDLQPSRSYAQVIRTSAAETHQMDHLKQERRREQQDVKDEGAAEPESAFNDAEDESTSKGKKATPKRARAVKNSNRSTKSKARPGLRKGKWTDEESRYATQLTNYFKEGLLPIERGTMLRLYLSQKLNCEPMRITKKFTGGECIGKQVFRPCSPTPESRVRLMQAQLELVALEAAFIKKLKENREEAPGSMDENDSGSNTENGPSRSSKPRQPAQKKRSSTRGANASSSEDDEGFTSDSSTSSARSFDRKAATTKQPSMDNEEDDADNANAVGLLLDFFYKANRNEKSGSDANSKCSSSVQSMKTASASSDESIANSPTKRIRALSISNYVNDDSLSKRSRVGSFTTVFAK